MKALTLVFISWAAYAQATSEVRPAPGQREQAEAINNSAETMNVLQAGSVGDGVADDTVPLAKAFAEACAAGKRSIYLPRGTFLFNPAAAKLEICSNETVSGPGTIRVKPESGNYAYIFGPKPVTKEVNNFTMEGVTVDQNAYQNASGAAAAADGRAQLVVAVYAGGNLMFRHLVISTSGVSAISANGPTIHDVTVDQCRFTFQKHNSTKPFDNSTIYINGKNFTVTNNTFVSKKEDAAVTAIEVHEGSGTISGNNVSWYWTGGNLVDTKDLTTTSNIIRNAGLGFQLWALDGKSTDHNTISNNTIELNQVTRGAQAASGIATYFSVGIRGDHANLLIAENKISFEAEGAGRKVAAYSNFGIGLQCLGNVRDAVIKNNVITDPPVRGIKIGVNTKEVTTSGVTVVDNRIINAGGNSDATAKEYSSALALEGNLSDIKVFNNTLSFSSRPAGKAKYSIYSNEKGYKYNGVAVFNNRIEGDSEKPTDGLTPGVRRTAVDK